MANTKDRRNSGRVYGKIYNPVEFPYEQVYWDDWIDHRDGTRQLGFKSSSWKHTSKQRHQWKICSFVPPNI